MNWIDTFCDGLFYKTDNRIVSYIEGLGVCTVKITFNEA